jgi:hypothetical protein
VRKLISACLLAFKAKTLIQEVLSLMQSNTGISQADLDDTKVLAVEVLAPLGLVDEVGVNQLYCHFSS